MALARGQLDLAEHLLPDAMRSPRGVAGGAPFVAPCGEFDAEHALSRGDVERVLGVVTATLDELDRSTGYGATAVRCTRSAFGQRRRWTMTMRPAGSTLCARGRPV